jgi:hypothetical protein
MTRINLKDTKNLKAKVICYGPSGSGKTHFSATFPEPIGVINTVPGNLNTLRKFPNKQILVEDFSTLTYPHNANELISFINKVVKGKEFAECETIVLDDYTGMMAIIMDLAQDKMTRSNGKKIISGKLGEPDQSHYHGENVKCTKIVHDLTRLDKHICISMHEKLERDKEEGKIISIDPLARGRERASQITSRVSEVYRMTTERRVVVENGTKAVKEVRMLQVEPDTLRYAKTSLCGLAGISDPLVEPNMSAILNLIKQKQETRNGEK